jgi:predicted deacylase
VSSAAVAQSTAEVDGAVVELAEPLPTIAADEVPADETPADDVATDDGVSAGSVAAEPDADSVVAGETTGAAGDDSEDRQASNVAENVDLSEPVDPAAMQAERAPLVDRAEAPAGPNVPPTYTNEQPSLFILGSEIPAATSTRLAWTPEQSFDGISVPTPILVVNGATRGPVLCLTAAVHGDELNGIEVVRRVMYDLEPEKLSGAVIGVPIVNLQGFRRGSRYLPDRRDLNRFFPGNPKGSLASRIAHSFFTEIIDNCEALVDLHTGSYKRTNLPQLRADLRNADVVELTRGFGSTVVLHSDGAEGTLRRAATDRGIPSVTLEAGEPQRLQEDEVEHGTKGVMTLLNELGMYRKVTFWGSREPVYYRSRWVRADRGGVLFSEVKLGERVRRNQVLGTITDPITNRQSTLRASSDGRILGMALNQFVMPGFAAYRIGIEAPERKADEADAPSGPTHTASADDDGTDEGVDDSSDMEAEEAGDAESEIDDGDDLENS